MREKRIDRNVDEEGKEIEKCMKRIAGRRIEKVYGTAAIRSIPAELRQAIKKEERGYKMIGGHKKTWVGIKGQK